MGDLISLLVWGISLLWSSDALRSTDYSAAMGSSPYYWHLGGAWKMVAGVARPLRVEVLAALVSRCPEPAQEGNEWWARREGADIGAPAWGQPDGVG